jgi:hypothetical protein
MAKECATDCPVAVFARCKVDGFRKITPKLEAESMGFLDGPGLNPDDFPDSPEILAIIESYNQHANSLASLAVDVGEDVDSISSGASSVIDQAVEKCRRLGQPAANKLGQLTFICSGFSVKEFDFFDALPTPQPALDSDNIT